MLPFSATTPPILDLLTLHSSLSSPLLFNLFFVNLFFRFCLSVCCCCFFAAEHVRTDRQTCSLILRSPLKCLSCLFNHKASSHLFFDHNKFLTSEIGLFFFPLLKSTLEIWKYNKVSQNEIGKYNGFINSLGPGLLLAKTPLKSEPIRE